MLDARRLTSRTLTRATLAALGVLFVVCSATAIGAVLTINRSGHDARVSRELAAAYLSAQNALSRDVDACCVAPVSGYAQVRQGSTR